MDFELYLILGFQFSSVWLQYWGNSLNTFYDIQVNCSNGTFKNKHSSTIEFKILSWYLHAEICCIKIIKTNIFSVRKQLCSYSSRKLSLYIKYIASQCTFSLTWLLVLSMFSSLILSRTTHLENGTSLSSLGLLTSINLIKTVSHKSA